MNGTMEAIAQKYTAPTTTLNFDRLTAGFNGYKTARKRKIAMSTTKYIPALKKMVSIGSHTLHMTRKRTKREFGHQALYVPFEVNSKTIR